MTKSTYDGKPLYMSKQPVPPWTFKRFLYSVRVFFFGFRFSDEALEPVDDLRRKFYSYYSTKNGNAGWIPVWSIHDIPEEYLKSGVIIKHHFGIPPPML